jgi:hypothetical protein
MKLKSLLTGAIAGVCLLGNTPLLSFSLADTLITEIQFQPPPGQGKPRKTSGAGSRQDTPCFQETSPEKSSLTPLVPSVGDGLTLAIHPTFFVYVPKTSASKIILSLQEENGRHHSQTTFPLHVGSRIVALKVPESLPALEVNKTYRWSAVLVCGEKPSPNDPGVVGWVQRSSITPQQPSNPLKQALWYGEQGIWYDLLTTLAQIQSPPLWSNFLTAMGFGTIATEPVSLSPYDRE